MNEFNSQYYKNVPYRVGIYDNTHAIEKEVYSLIDKRAILSFDDDTTMGFPQSDPMSHLYAKYYFLSACRHYIIAVDTTSSISILTGAINLILKDQSKSLLVVASIDLSSLLEVGDYAEKKLLNKRKAEGTFVIQKEFELNQAIRLVGN